MGNLVFQATLGGQVNLVGPNTASTYNINVPAVAGTMVTTGDTGTVSSTMLASSLSLTTPNINVATGTSLKVTSGFYSTSSSSFTYTDGIVMDYTTGLGRISVGTSDGLAFYNAGVATTELMRLDSSGNLGIGTSSPSYKLDISGSNPRARVSPTTGTDYAFFQAGNTGGNAFVGLENSTGSALSTGAAYSLNVYHGGAYPILFSTNAAERMRIDSSGNVGIGTSSPSDSQVFGKSVDLRGTTGSAYYSGTTDATTRAYFATYTGGAYLGTETNHPQIFRTSNTERMRIDSSGNLLVGTTSQIGSAKLSVLDSAGTGIGIKVATNGNLGCNFQNSSGGQVGFIQVNASTTLYSTSSDYRLKENIEPMTGALSVVQQLKPVTYTWKADGSAGQGFIAHELQAVVPDCVTGEKDAVDADGNPVYQGIDTSFLVATLTAAIQEQQAIITQLQADVAALKAPQ